MTEEQKKRLTEFLGECWHDMKEEILECRNCGKSKIEIFMEPYKVSLNRTFLTPDDQQACMEALVRGGLWKEFYYYYWKCGVEVECSSWLFRPVNEVGEAHFCALVAEFLGEYRKEKIYGKR